MWLSVLLHLRRFLEAWSPVQGWGFIRSRLLLGLKLAGSLRFSHQVTPKILSDTNFHIFVVWNIFCCSPIQYFLLSLLDSFDFSRRTLDLYLLKRRQTFVANIPSFFDLSFPYHLLYSARYQTVSIKISRRMPIHYRRLQINHSNMKNMMFISFIVKYRQWKISFE